MRKRAVLISGVLGLALLLAAAVLTSTVLSGESRTPRETVQAYFDAQINGDADSMCALLTSTERANRTICAKSHDEKWAESVRWLSYEITDVLESGDTATVEYIRTDKNPQFAPHELIGSGILLLKSEGDEWLIQGEEYSVDDPANPTA